MNSADAEYLVSRILSGVLRIKVKDISGQTISLLLKNPTPYDRYLSNEVYRQIYEENKFEPIFTDEQINSILLEDEVWTVEKEAKLESLKDDIEELKVRMFEAGFNLSAMNTARKVLAAARIDLQKLTEEKFSYFYTTLSGMAEIEKNKFLIALSLYYLDNSKLLDEDSYWEFPGYIIEQVLVQYKNSRINEAEFRWLARNEPWRSYWICRKCESKLFGIPSSELNDEQKTIITWSTIYDNISENPECPSDEVINDDDVLDGWMILQKRKRQTESNKSAVEKMIGNDKIANSKEVFIPVQDKESMKKVHSLNDTQSDMIRRQRLNYINKKGIVKEADMPDTRKELNMKRVQMISEKVEG